MDPNPTYSGEEKNSTNFKSTSKHLKKHARKILIYRCRFKFIFHKNVEIYYTSL